MRNVKRYPSTFSFFASNELFLSRSIQNDATFVGIKCVKLVFTLYLVTIAGAEARKYLRLFVALLLFLWTGSWNVGPIGITGSQTRRKRYPQTAHAATHLTLAITSYPLTGRSWNERSPFGKEIFSPICRLVRSIFLRIYVSIYISRKKLERSSWLWSENN